MPRFYQTIATTKEKRFPKSFKLLLKPGTSGPRDSFKLLQKRNTWEPEILSNYFKNKAWDPQDSFKLLQKENEGRLGDSFKLLRKPVTTSPRSYLECFKNQAQGFPDILSNYFKKQNSRSPRRSFKLLQKYYLVKKCLFTVNEFLV